MLILLPLAVIAAGGAHGLADAAALEKSALLRHKHFIQQILRLDNQRQCKITKLFSRQSPA